MIWVHIVDLSGGWLFAFATHAWAWHGSLTPQSASDLQVSVLFKGAGSRHAGIVGGAPTSEVALVTGDDEATFVGDAVGSPSNGGLTEPSGGAETGGGPHAAERRAAAPRATAAARIHELSLDGMVREALITAGGARAYTRLVPRPCAL